jgi:hypothetical protein
MLCVRVCHANHHFFFDSIPTNVRYRPAHPLPPSQKLAYSTDLNPPCPPQRRRRAPNQASCPQRGGRLGGRKKWSAQGGGGEGGEGGVREEGEAALREGEQGQHQRQRGQGDRGRANSPHHHGRGAALGLLAYVLVCPRALARSMTRRWEGVVGCLGRTRLWLACLSRTAV